jgi:N-sulfoglucosamine sulfohydrolase
MYLEAKRQLREKLIAELTIQKDPRIVGDGAIFDEYPYAGQAHRGFYERFMQGENLTAGWVNPSDFEKQPIGEVKKKE